MYHAQQLNRNKTKEKLNFVKMSSDACDFHLETPLAGMPQDKDILSFNI